MFTYLSLVQHFRSKVLHKVGIMMMIKAALTAGSEHHTYPAWRVGWTVITRGREFPLA